MTAQKTRSWKRNVLASLVAVAALWPGAQYGLARVYDLDPWEFFGMAMYAVPHPRTELEIEATVDGTPRPVHTAGSLRARLREHARRRTTFGTLVSDEPFARALLDENPGWEAVTLRSWRWRLDRSDARIHVEERAAVFDRAGPPDRP